MSRKLKVPYTRIANDQLERLYVLRLPTNSFCAFMWIYRNSYGWGREFASNLGLRKMGKELGGMASSSVLLALRVLLEAKIINKDEKGRFLINKKCNEWVYQAKRGAQPTERAQPAEQGQTLSPLSETAPSAERTAPSAEQTSPKSPIKSKGSRVVKKVVKKGKKTTPAPGKTGADKPYKIKNETQRIICAYKVVIGFKADDRAWDRENFTIYLRAGGKLRRAFQRDRKKGDNAITQEAGSWLAVFADKMEEAGRSWNLATAAKIAWDEKAKRDSDTKIKTWENQKGRGVEKSCNPTQSGGSKLKKSLQKSWMSCIK